MKQNQIRHDQNAAKPRCNCERTPLAAPTTITVAEAEQMIRDNTVRNPDITTKPVTPDKPATKKSDAEISAEIDAAARAALNGGKRIGVIDRDAMAIRLCILRGGMPDKYTRLDDRELASRYLDARANPTNKLDGEAKALADYKARSRRAWQTPTPKETK